MKLYPGSVFDSSKSVAPLMSGSLLLNLSSLYRRLKEKRGITTGPFRQTDLEFIHHFSPRQTSAHTGPVL